MMAMVEDPPNPAHAARESDLKIFFVSIVYGLLLNWCALQVVASIVSLFPLRRRGFTKCLFNTL